MSTLEEQIAALQFQKHKAELFKNMLKLIADLQVEEQFKEAFNEAFLEVNDFIKSKIDSIESRKAVQAVTEETSFTADEMNILRAVIARASQLTLGNPPAQPAGANGAFANEDDPQPPPRRPNPVNRKDTTQDKIRFAMANRHLDSKRVTVITNNGTIGGKVVGIDAPHIIVKTDTGHTIPVDLENITLENK